MPTQLDKVIYTARAHTTGGRDGASRSDDGLLDVKIAPPKAMGGAGNATNPEQLFAAGYSACFMGALKHVAAMKKVAVPADASIDAEVDIGPIPQGFGIAAPNVAAAMPKPPKSMLRVTTAFLPSVGLSKVVISTRRLGGRKRS